MTLDTSGLSPQYSRLNHKESSDIYNGTQPLTILVFDFSLINFSNSKMLFRMNFLLL